MAFIAILGIALFITFNTGWRVFLFATVPTIFTIPLLWSKGAIVTFGLGFILTIIFVIVKFGWTHRLLTICIGSILLVAVIFLSPSQPLVVQRFVADFITGESTSLTSRMSRWDSALLIITSNPWFGISFDPSFDIGDDIGINRVFRSHNQYIDIWLKSGSISLLLFIIVLSVLVFRLFMRYKSHLEFLPEFGISVGLLSAWISTITVSNMSQVNFNQLYSAGILWFSIGLFEGYYIHKHKRI
jgi:O-antigen ligase